MLGSDFLFYYALHGELNAISRQAVRYGYN